MNTITKPDPTMLEHGKVVSVPSATLTPMEMLNTAINRGADMEVLSKLMDLQERWEKTQARKAYDDAIASAKAEIPPIPKNREGHNNRKYADLAGMAAIIDPIVTKFGLSYRWRTTQTDRIMVTCVITHRAGHYEENTLAGPADMSGSKNAIQAIGSTLTYLQRYSIMQALGLSVTDDDDGEASAKRVANGDFSGDYDDGVPNRLTKALEPKKLSRDEQAKKDWQDKYTKWKGQMDACTTVAQVEKWKQDNRVYVNSSPERWAIAAYYEDILRNLREAELSNQVVHDSDSEDPRPANYSDFYEGDTLITPVGNERASSDVSPPATGEASSEPHQRTPARVPLSQRAIEARNHKT